MNRLTFRSQIRIGFGVFLLCIVAAMITKQGIFHNIGWIIYGLLFIINPVWPQRWNYADHRKLKRGARIAGILAVVVGLITRFGA